MKQSHFSFVIACYILYTFRSNVLNPMATEIIKPGACPANIKGMQDLKTELNGIYSAVAMYSKDRFIIPHDSCYKLRFKPINNDESEVKVVWKNGLIPFRLNLWFKKLSTKNEGIFQILDGVTGAIPLGQAYILGQIGKDKLLYYSCRPGLLFHHREVLVLTKDETISYTAEEKTEVEKILKENNLDYGYLRNVDQSRDSCAGLINSYL